jgi:PleD family two-component response regulator
MGVGLAITRSMIDVHGGHLAAHNNPNGGDLLRHAAHRRRQAMTAPSESLVGIVDDDPSVRKALARLVKAAGYRVEVFRSAREFLARPQEEDLRCLLLDVRMPGLTGLELQEALAIAGRRMSIAHFGPRRHRGQRQGYEGRGH